MDPGTLVVWGCIALAAALYSSVGHGGATAYLAILALAGYASASVASPVLILNMAAAGFAFVRFGAAGHLRVRLLLPFVVAGVPAAYLGGRTPLDVPAQNISLGLALAVAAARMLLVPRPWRITTLPSSGWGFWATAIPVGGACGFLAGTTGIGGGIFLSPLLVGLGWADVRRAGSVASAFIVLNSAAGLAARWGRVPMDWDLALPLFFAVLMGAFGGSWLGAKRLDKVPLQRVLGLVLTVAALRVFLL